MKRRVIACVLLLCLFLSGCGSDTSISALDTNASGELLVYINRVQNISFNSPINRFTKKYPNIKVAVVDQDYYGIAHNEDIIQSGQASQKMKTELMAGGGPDLIFLGSFSDGNINDFYKITVILIDCK